MSHDTAGESTADAHQRDPDERVGELALQAKPREIVRRHCYRVLARVETQEEAAAALAGATAPSNPEESLVARHQCVAIATALAALEPLHREVILLRDIEGLTAPEAAARLGVSIDAVKSRLHRARARLREEVASRLGP